MEKWKFFTLPGLELPPPHCRPARSQSLYRLSYPGSVLKINVRCYTGLCTLMWIVVICGCSPEWQCSLCSVLSNLGLWVSVDVSLILSRFWVTIGAVYDRILDLLIIYRHNSELQTIAAPSLISTIYKSPRHPLNLFHSAVSLLTVPWQRLLTVEILQFTALRSSLHWLPYRTDSCEHGDEPSGTIKCWEVRVNSRTTGGF
jgi:hypothetical protein